MLEVVFILDRSGSMSGLEADTIGGFNSMLEKQKAESDDVVWSTVLFDHDQTVLMRRKSHRVRGARHDDQKTDECIDDQNFHNGISVHCFFLADLAAALKKAVYQGQKDPDHR